MKTPRFVSTEWRQSARGKPLCDHTADLSDVWQEQTDPRQEWEEQATGLFDFDDCSGLNERLEVEHYTCLHLKGIEVDGEYMNRETAIKCLGYKVVCAIEDWETEVGL